MCVYDMCSVYVEVRGQGCVVSSAQPPLCSSHWLDWLPSFQPKHLHPWAIFQPHILFWKFLPLFVSCFQTELGNVCLYLLNELWIHLFPSRFMFWPSLKVTGCFIQTMWIWDSPKMYHVKCLLICGMHLSCSFLEIKVSMIWCLSLG